jgi:hypothetical protein
VVEHREEVTVVAESARQLVRWTQQHGMRAVWDAVPEQRKAIVESELIAEAAKTAHSTGRLTFGFPVAYFLAHTAPAE